MSEEKQIELLRPFITDSRLERLDSVLGLRTRALCLVVEELKQEHNLGALMRSADIFGLQDIHLISDRYAHKLAKAISKGARDWVDLHNYGQQGTAAQDCVQNLKAQGYKLVVAHPEDAHWDWNSYQFKEPIALVMGSEWEGISDYMLEQADYRIAIPQYGFTQSLNVSVSAGILLSKFRAALDKSDFAWQLSEPEKQSILLKWMKNTLGHQRAEKILEHQMQA